MKVSVYNQKGEETGTTILPKEIFGVSVNPDLIHQVVVSQMANKRINIAHTKDRGEVSGGGRKPWRQKGTGRARHGSIRSPLWIGGGVTFGPRKDRVFSKKINKKMKRLAFFMTLSAKLKKNLLVVLDKLQIEKNKTKLMKEILEKLPCKNESVLIVLPNYDKNLILASRNLAKAKAIQAKDLNVLDLISFKYLVMPKETIKIIKDQFLKNAS